MPLTAAHRIYAEQLVGLGYGLPLWQPEPTKFGEVQIGDVGYVLEGSFYRLFNALEPKDHPANVNGVPEEFTPLNIDRQQLLHVKEGFLPPGPISTKSVTYQRVEAGFTVQNVADAGLSYTFKSNGKRGATLVLGGPAKQELLHRNAHFRDYMYYHHESWYKLVQQKGLLLAREEIIFVSGTVKTTEWALTAFDDVGTEHGFSLSAPGGNIVSSKFAFSTETQVQASPSQRSGPVRNRGTAGRLSISASESQRSDQCLFLRYYKVKYRPLLSAPSVAEVPTLEGTQDCSSDIPRCCTSYCSAACHLLLWPCRQCGSGAANLASKANSGPEPSSLIKAAPMKKSFSVHEIPDVAGSQPKDPIEDVLNYIIERTKAEIAIASHDDVYDVCTKANWPVDSDLQRYLLQKHPPLVYGKPKLNETGASDTTENPDLPAPAPTEPPAEHPMPSLEIPPIASHPQQGTPLTVPESAPSPPPSPPSPLSPVTPPVSSPSHDFPESSTGKEPERQSPEMVSQPADTPVTPVIQIPPDVEDGDSEEEEEELETPESGTDGMEETHAPELPEPANDDADSASVHADPRTPTTKPVQPEDIPLPEASPENKPSEPFGVPRVRHAWVSGDDNSIEKPVLGALDLFGENGQQVLVKPLPYAGAPYSTEPLYPPWRRDEGRPSESSSCCNCVVM